MTHEERVRRILALLEENRELRTRVGELSLEKEELIKEIARVSEELSLIQSKSDNWALTGGSND